MNVSWAILSSSWEVFHVKPIKSPGRGNTTTFSKRAGALIDTLIMSLDKPDAALDEQWLREAESRTAAYRSGTLGAVDAEDVFKEMDTIG